ncbi:hypothetical protein F5144DRAFT_491660 [Chaetomium tenue]|uniref:Uncharacterized protein n=1 Tax=Chaetomium tenue TaxID=1854479 RepID=A0ACB7P8B1_9PEZI|nr:hypothetical protein F5144DRAFT_491660 [Chaetomium globosum]
MGGYHFHVSGGAVVLMLQSDTLWFLPPLGAALINPKAEALPGYVAFAHGQALYAPPDYSSDDAPVIVPKPHILLEARMRILARDDGTERGEWRSSHNIPDDRWDYINLDLLPRPFKVYYKANKSETISRAEYVVGLKRTLGVPVDPKDYDLDPKKYGF